MQNIHKENSKITITLENSKQKRQRITMDNESYHERWIQAMKGNT